MVYEYDAILKAVLTRMRGQALARVTGFAVERWHNTELPAVRHRRADLLGETADGSLVHIELQSTNHPHMAVRMLEYALAIRRRFRRLPEQVVLYVGNGPLRMNGVLTGPGLTYECRITDIRELDAEPLIASEALEDNVIAVLMRLRNEHAAVRRILRHVAAGESLARETAIGELLTLAGLRKFGKIIEQEVQNMPILDDIMDHEVIGRERKRGMAMGREEGLAEGLLIGERRVLTRQIGRRFGAIPGWAQDRLDALSGEDLERIGLRLLDAATLEELFA